MSANKILSLSIDSEFQERVKKEAKRKNVSVSKLIRDIVEKSLPSDPDSNIVYDTIILKIPSEAKSNTESLQAWLKPRFDAILKNLVSNV
jgi:hypothetical protein